MAERETHAAATPDEPLWHTMTTEAVARRFEVSVADGLTPEEAAARCRRSGPNVIVEQRQRGPLQLLTRQFKDFTVLVLIAAAVIAGLICVL